MRFARGLRQGPLQTRTSCASNLHADEQCARSRRGYRRTLRRARILRKEPPRLPLLLHRLLLQKSDVTRVPWRAWVREFPVDTWALQIRPYLRCVLWMEPDITGRGVNAPNGKESPRAPHCGVCAGKAWEASGTEAATNVPILRFVQRSARSSMEAALPRQGSGLSAEQLLNEGGL